MAVDPEEPTPPVVLVHGFATSSGAHLGRERLDRLAPRHGPRRRRARSARSRNERQAPRPGGLRPPRGRRVGRVSAPSPSMRSGSRSARGCCSIWRRSTPSASGGWWWRASAPTCSGGDDPDLIANAILGEGPTENPVGQYFRGLASDPESDPEALVAYLRRSGHRPLTDEGLGRITAPVLVVLGDRDFAGPADPLLDKLPDARSGHAARRRPLRHAQAVRVHGRRLRLPRRGAGLVTGRVRPRGRSRRRVWRSLGGVPSRRRPRARGGSWRRSARRDRGTSRPGALAGRVRRAAPQGGPHPSHVPHDAADRRAVPKRSGGSRTPGCGSGSSPTASSPTGATRSP